MASCAVICCKRALSDDASAAAATAAATASLRTVRRGRGDDAPVDKPDSDVRGALVSTGVGEVTHAISIDGSSLDCDGTGLRGGASQTWVMWRALGPSVMERWGRRGRGGGVSVAGPQGCDCCGRGGVAVVAHELFWGVGR